MYLIIIVFIYHNLNVFVYHYLLLFQGICKKIGSMLQDMIDRKLVTNDTDDGQKAYSITEECIRLARSVTGEGNIYVRQRRRRAQQQRRS